ncbi:hypothetical protein [Kitasatospora cheerisanensis]|uniref:Uncharacterized protein n=1 Tax=Kitasatospora cheerisanensis KCTC 2395 TaxID=1348663 RepID=A0A066ZCT2_9ACTN|nr:hypothetical protein [Kitasatospora cheerisanensis]KDN87960.1 hypothetical protein KCH_02870 [Kitasatospora cheerisanensis KCTC 2395]
MRETSPPAGRTLERLRRADDVLDLQAAGRRGGTAAVLRRLAARTRAGVLLLHPTGTDACPPPTPVGTAERALARSAVREAATRAAGSAAVGSSALTCLVVTLPGRPGTRPPVLAAVAPGPPRPNCPSCSPTPPPCSASPGTPNTAAARPTAPDSPTPAPAKPSCTC